MLRLSLGVNITLDDSDLERSITLTADSAEKLIMNNMVPWWIIILGMFYHIFKPKI